MLLHDASCLTRFDSTHLVFELVFESMEIGLEFREQIYLYRINLEYEIHINDVNRFQFVEKPFTPYKYVEEKKKTLSFCMENVKLLVSAEN